MFQCANCGRILEEVRPGSAVNYSFDKSLHIQVHLGYGEYQDQDMDAPPSPMMNFCEFCSDDLVDIFPGFKKLLGK